MSKWKVPWGRDVEVMRRSRWGENADVWNRKMTDDLRMRPAKVGCQDDSAMRDHVLGLLKGFTQTGDKIMPPLSGVGGVG